MIRRAYEARLACDTPVAGEVIEVPGGVELRTPDLPDSYDYNAILLAPGADAAAVHDAAARIEPPGRRVIAFGPSEPVDLDGWQREELLAMVFDGEPPERPDEVVEVPADVLREARRRLWPPQDAEQLLEMQARQAAAGTLLAILRDGEPLAWAQMVGGVIDDVWVQEPARGQGLGRAVTRAAMAAGGRVLFCDVDDPRPQGLYRSLGFTDAGRVVQFLRG